MDRASNGSVTDRDRAIVDRLTAMTHLTRLAILRMVRRPRSLREIEVFDGGGAAERPRPLSRQTVRWHLDALIEAGAVTARETTREFGPTTEYFVNHPWFFLLAEELRELARLRASVEPSGATIASSERSPIPSGRPALILVKGLDEGTTFPLLPAGELVIGRKREANVSLDFDSTVSSENALIRREGDRAYLRDVPGSRNGTTHNLRRLGAEEEVELRHGDLVGVGKCLLLYWA